MNMVAALWRSAKTIFVGAICAFGWLIIKGVKIWL